MVKEKYWANGQAEEPGNGNQEIYWMGLGITCGFIIIRSILIRPLAIGSQTLLDFTK